MKWTISSAILALVASSALAWSAGQSLKSMMKEWKVAAQITSQMADGAIPFDEAKAHSAIETFVADSQAIGDRLPATTAASKDIKRRFAKFDADASAALAVTGSRAEFNHSWAKVLGECKSCHDQYAN
jgi:cytochrome c556